jgi:hypothetical protein
MRGIALLSFCFFSITSFLCPSRPYVLGLIIFIKNTTNLKQIVAIKRYFDIVSKLLKLYVLKMTLTIKETSI